MSEPTEGGPTSQYDFIVEGAQVRRFAEAAWDANPAYLPHDADWTGLIPPTFIGAAATLCGRQHSLKAMGFDVARAFHGSETIHMRADVTAGTVLRVKESIHHLSDVHGARGGTMRRAARRCQFLDGDGREVAVTERIILETTQVLTTSHTAVGDLGVFDDGLELRKDPMDPQPVPMHSLHVGHRFPPASFGPVTRADFVRYAAASGDLTAIHFDEYAARSRGYPSPFAMGMFSAALMGHVLTDWLTLVPPWSLTIRFKDIVWPGETLAISGTVESSTDGRREVRMKCIAQDRVVTTALFQPAG